MRVADLPGLIEGASSNKGLGHAFLKHTEKAKALALVVSSRSVGRVLHRYRRGHGFEFRSGLNFFLSGLNFRTA